MVKRKVNQEVLPQVEVAPPHFPDELKWTTIGINEILEKENRLEASVYGLEGRQARETLKACKWPLKKLGGNNGLAKLFYPNRFKRIYVAKSPLSFFQPSQINCINPKPNLYISPKTKTDLKLLRAKRNQILLTRSGTIGNCTLVSNTLEGKIFSDDLIRITTNKPEVAGYLYAYLRSRIGYALVNTNNYGAVISHIEPKQLEDIPIPNPTPILINQIHSLIIESFRLRDESNHILNSTQILLKKALKFPEFDKIKASYFDNKAELQNYSVKLSNLNERLDASYHIPIVHSIENHLRKNSAEITNMGDNRISQKILLPGRFKRVYVKEGQGIVFFSGKNIQELIPNDIKYLSFSQHQRKIKEELTLQENMILVTCSGTVGNMTLVPKHWEGWAMTHDIIRIIPNNISMAGYIYAWLSSEYAFPLIARTIYGSVVGHIEKEHISKITIPFLADKHIQEEINSKVLEANQKRYEAYRKEKEAMDILNGKVIYSEK